MPLGRDSSGKLKVLPYTNAPNVNPQPVNTPAPQSTDNKMSGMNMRNKVKGFVDGLKNTLTGGPQGIVNALRGNNSQATNRPAMDPKKVARRQQMRNNRG